MRIGANVQGNAADWSPQELTISVGDSVYWDNQDTAAHTATTRDGAPESFDITIGGNEASDPFVFTEPGTYDYYCQFHPLMADARIIVEE